jgi:hypothetical protein
VLASGPGRIAKKLVESIACLAGLVCTELDFAVPGPGTSVQERLEEAQLSRAHNHYRGKQPHWEVVRFEDVVAVVEHAQQVTVLGHAPMPDDDQNLWKTGLRVLAVPAPRHTLDLWAVVTMMSAVLLVAAAIVQVVAPVIAAGSFAEHLLALVEN